MTPYLGLHPINWRSKFDAMGLGWIGAVSLHPSLVAPKERA